MQTKIAYALVSSGDDIYAAMLLVSLHTLRVRNPQAEVLVVMDETTHQRLEELHSPILSYATPVVVRIPPEYGKVQRSRYLKTTMRERVQGDFLFLDGDTLVSDSLADIDEVKADIAMVTDLNRPIEMGRIEYGIKMAKKAGLFVEGTEKEPYFNSGVMFVRDTKLAHDFFRKWHETWKWSSGNGVHLDQPPLCETNRTMGHPIQELSGIWNCQYRFLNYRYYEPYAKKAKILHYYTTFGLGAFLSVLVNRVHAKGRVDAIAAAIARWPRLFVRVHKISKAVRRLLPGKRGSAG